MPRTGHAARRTSTQQRKHVEHDGSAVACNDDDGSCFENDFASTLSTTASGSGLFQLVVDGYSASASGSYRLDVTSF